MEPTDFDNFLREKLARNNDSFAKQIEHSKPYVWSAIHKNLSENKSKKKWIFAAAAVILLLIGFSSILYFMQKQHHKEINRLAIQLIELKQNYSTNFNQLEIKNQQLLCFESDIKQLQQLQSEIVNNEIKIQSTQYVYLKDTIIIKDQPYLSENNKLDTLDNHIVKSIAISDINQLYNKIYPVYNTTKVTNPESESMKFRINSFASNQ